MTSFQENGDREFLLSRLPEFLQACHAKSYLRKHLKAFSGRQVGLIALGKAAPDMMQVAVAYLGCSHGGIMVARKGEEKYIDGIQSLGASHPIPDQSSMEAAKAICSYLQHLPQGLPVVFLLSGGASSMACLPVEGMSLHEKAALSRQLMHQGANIHELNVVRRAYSQFKGGGMLGHAQGPVHSFVLSDVPGDDPAIIGSGPSWPGDGDNPLPVLQKFSIPAPKVQAKKTTKSTWEHQYKIVATPINMLAAVEKSLRANDWSICNLGDCEEGSPRDMAARHLNILQQQPSSNMAILSGGEAASMVLGDGIGGPNREYVLEIMLEAKRRSLPGSLTAFAIDTDGVDGGNDVAGAVLCLHECNHQDWEDKAKMALSQSDSGRFLDGLEASIRTGPTGTNLNDLRILLWRP